MLIIVMFVTIAILILLYDYLRIRGRLSQTERHYHQAKTDIKNIAQTEQALNDELQSSQNQLKKILEDPITHLIGYKFFEDRLQLSIKEAERYQLTIGVLYIDIRDFKFINNVLSYEIGDALLQEIANRLKICIRQVDSITRVSKDIFVVLLTQLAKPETAAVVAARMLHALSEVFLVKEHELFVNTSIGIALYPADAKDSKALLNSAEEALNMAKQKGQNTFQFYQEAMHQRSQRTLALYTHLNRETIFQEFSVLFQPIMNIKEETIICVDALLNWQPTFGEVNAAEIFSVAEKQGKANLFTEWLLQTACKQFLHARTIGLDYKLLAIPITLQQLENSHFIYRLSQLLQSFQFNPHELMLEIKMNFPTANMSVLEKSFNMLHYLGIHIAINHFGTTSFPLHYLKNFNIQFLKLDSDFIFDLTENEQAKKLLSAILIFATSLSIQVVIQGVVSNEQLSILKQLGFTLLQGEIFDNTLPQDPSRKIILPTE